MLGKHYLVFVGFLFVSGAFAAPVTVSGKLTHVIIMATADPAKPTTIIALNPLASQCAMGLMGIPSPELNLGRSIVASALSAQAAGLRVDVTMDPDKGCAVSQLVVVSP